MTAKRARVGPKPEELKVGVSVVYGSDGKTGVVSDAFAPLNQFWVRDGITNEVVRDEIGDIIAFGAEELQIEGVPSAPAKTSQSARVLVIGTEDQMLQIIQHFGEPDVTQRKDTQMLLALPCSSCGCGPNCSRFDPTLLNTCEEATCPVLTMADQGMDPSMRQLAQSLRPDIAEEIQLRSYHLKQALEQLGPDMVRLDGFYCLSALQMPYGLYDIESADWQDRPHMEDVCRQIDLSVTASGKKTEDEASLEVTARRVLGEACGISISERIWEEDVQMRLRKLLQVDLPVRYWDGPDAKGYVLILPTDLNVSVRGRTLQFSQPYTREANSASDARSKETTPAAEAKASADRGIAAAATDPSKRTVTDWKELQHEFKHLPKLPGGWIRIKSRSNEIYFYNTSTEKSQFDFPLPEGWTKHTSKSNGKVYYFHAKLNKSSYDIPKE